MTLESKLQALVAECDALRKERYSTTNWDPKAMQLLFYCAEAMREALLAVAEPPTVREQLNEMFGKEKVDYAIAEAETGVAEPPALVPGAFDIALAHSAFAPYPDRPPAPRSLSAEQKHEQFLAWWIQQEYRNSYPTSIMRACESAWNGALLSAPRCIGYPDCDGDLEGEPHSEKCLATALAERQPSLSIKQAHEQFLTWWVQQEYRTTYPQSVMGACEAAWNGALLALAERQELPAKEGRNWKGVRWIDSIHAADLAQEIALHFAHDCEDSMCGEDADASNCETAWVEDKLTDFLDSVAAEPSSGTGERK